MNENKYAQYNKMQTVWSYRLFKTLDAAHIETTNDCHQRVEITDIYTFFSNVNKEFYHPDTVLLF